MIIPMIHRWLRRQDVALLVAEIAQYDATAAQEAARHLDAGDVDLILDSDIALDTVRGCGGTPAALPLPLLWYVPVRATLRHRGEPDIDIADFTATLPVTFVSWRAVRRLGIGEPRITKWTEVISSLPRGTVVRAERATYCAALALWWAGCFPERITSVGGNGMVRAFADFAGWALGEAGRILEEQAPDRAELYRRAAERASVILEALRETRADYIGHQAHTVTGRLSRYLRRLGDAD